MLFPGSSDYVGTDGAVVLPFTSCERIHCIYIRIIDDDVLEEDESFQLFLFRNGLDSDIHLGNVSSTILIIDNDGELENPPVADLELVKGGLKMFLPKCL